MDIVSDRAGYHGLRKVIKEQSRRDKEVPLNVAGLSEDEISELLEAAHETIKWLEEFGGWAECSEIIKKTREHEKSVRNVQKKKV